MRPLAPWFVLVLGGLQLVGALQQAAGGELGTSGLLGLGSCGWFFLLIVGRVTGFWRWQAVNYYRELEHRALRALAAAEWGGRAPERQVRQLRRRLARLRDRMHQLGVRDLPLDVPPRQ